MAQNNPALFDALMAGGCGGTLERWITSTSSSSYEPSIDAVEAFATAVDAAIPVIGGDGPTISQINLVQSIAQGIVAGRNLASIDAGVFAEIAASIAAVFAQCEPLLNNVPVIPSGGGGSGQVAHTRYVDASTTVPLIDQDGSFGAPFALAASAMAALEAIEAAGAEGAAFCMMVWPGNYAAEGNLEWEPAFNTSTLSIVGANGLNFVPDVNINQIPIFESLSTANDGFLSLKGIIVSGAAGVLANGALDVQGCQLWNVCESSLASRFLDSYMVGVACVMGGGSFDGGRIQAGSFTMAEGNDLTLTNCQYEGAAITIAGAGGSLRVDAMSNYWVIESAPSLTGVSKVIMGSLTP